ncbi:extracellular solute-binding protein [Paenibacillus sp. JX-17]|uniref:Extracellular solute-binding protein n=1 Tax=Paenibacillus lacisoli TaxID=3064525 RepID=A0ABT9CHA2_9BACL|nr:extracellular solute-binding protein [Paenibacillus sp. JX-17]MDO7908659.1 extracellular solute-binding protein [Paenibacillus sp. JX-17]
MKALKVLIIAAVMGLTACSSSAGSDSPVTLKVWTTTVDQATTVLKERIKRFESEHPNIKVQVEELSMGAASSQFKTSMLGSDAPDLFRSDNAWVSELGELGLLHPLDDYITESDRKDFIDSAIQSVEHNHQLMGLPIVMEAPALLYNKKMLQSAGLNSPPATMNELLEDAKKLTDENHYGIYLSNDSYIAQSYLWAFGGGTVTNDKEIRITSPESKAAIEFMLTLKKEQVIQPYSDYQDGYEKMMNDFKEGRAAMTINGPWAVNDILSGQAFKDPANLGITAVPKGPGGQGSPAGGHSWVMGKYSQHPEEAYELAHFLTDTSTQLELTKQLKTLPTRKSTYENAELQSDLVVQGFKTQLEAAKSRPLFPEEGQLYSDFTGNLSDILLGSQSIDEGLNNIQNAWKTLLNIKD